MALRSFTARLSSIRKVLRPEPYGVTVYCGLLFEAERCLDRCQFACLHQPCFGFDKVGHIRGKGGEGKICRWVAERLPLLADSFDKRCPDRVRM